MITTLRPPGPKSRFPGDLLLRFTRDRLKFLVDLGRLREDMVYFELGGQPFYFANHPDYIRDILITHNRCFMKGRALQIAKLVVGEGLLTSEGAVHLTQRRLMQPAFHAQRVADFGTTMTAYADRQASEWSHETTLDINEEMMRLTLAIVARTLFSADVEAEARDLGQVLSTVLKSFNRYLIPLSEYYMKLPLPFNIRAAHAKKRLDESIYRIINQRRASGEDTGDLLSMLLLAQDAEGDGSGMSDTQVHDEAITLFIAGHETTAQALTWTWYLLSQNPDIERRFHTELDAVIGERSPTVADLKALVYTNKILMESMRLYPPAYAMGRKALEDCPIGPYIVPKGATVLMSQYTLHRDARFFPEPEQFNPDRWTPEFEATLPKFAYFPFGGGVRKCIGEQFALIEGVLLLASLGRHWQFRLTPGHPVEPYPSITLRTKYGVKMTFQKRLKG